MAQEKIELTPSLPSVTYTATTALPAGVYSPLITWQVPIQAGWYIPQNPKLLLSIMNSSGVQLPTNTTFILAYQRPTDYLPTALGSMFNYGFYATHSISVQASTSYDSETRLNLYAPKSFVQNTYLMLLVNPPVSFTPVWTGTYASEVYLKSITQVNANA